MRTLCFIIINSVVCNIYVFVSWFRTLAVINFVCKATERKEDRLETVPYFIYLHCSANDLFIHCNILPFLFVTYLLLLILGAQVT